MNTDGLAEFLDLSRTLSFTKTAKNLGVSGAHVSRRIAQLEDRLSVRLFHRSTRSVHLTPIGEEFLISCRRINDAVEHAHETVLAKDQALRGSVRIASLSGSYADQVVIPAMVQFSKDHPDVDLEIDFSPRSSNLLDENFDFAVRAGESRDSSLVRRTLAKRTRIVAASPAYLGQRGAPKSPDDLVNHDCLLAAGASWKFTVNGAETDVFAKGPIATNYGPAILEACKAGLGLAQMTVSGFGDSIEGGEVVPVLEEYWASEQHIYLLFPDRKFLPRRVSAAMKAIEEQAVQVRSSEKGTLSRINC
ncbi:LysR family transcriptional regulator [Yoonia sp. R2331]|uniref:LysR family transcriptional regulator n=1 Tax=Yoonia sp. R2331 TaxID=3237238 RepID=UPI0034E3FBA5